MQRLLIFFVSVFFTLSLSAQHLHSPEEIVQIMEESTVNYVIDSLLEPINAQALPILESNWMDESVSVQKQDNNNKTTKKVQKYQKKGEKCIKNNKYEKAIGFYTNIIKIQPSLYAYKKIGDCYASLKDTSNALKTFELALNLNPMDFEVHHKLAIYYQYNGQGKASVKHITLAHLLNRNHSEILQRLKEIYQINNHKYADWTFTPQYVLNVDQSNTVNIAYKETPWLAYANCKAIWQNEVGYSEKMVETFKTEKAMLQEKECLMNALITYDQLETDEGQFPALKVLATALQKQKIDDFIFYEIQSRENPTMIYQASEEKINQLAEYLMNFRN